MSTSTLGENIRKARNRRDLTQLALAHAIGLKGDDAGAYICRIEGGSQEPRLDTLTKLAKALKVKLDFLLTGKK